jgi:diketogulonate reductase-like aldo/keto reductase
MIESTLGGRFTLPTTSLTVHRIGYGAMQLAGPGVWGPPKDPDAACAVLREAVAAGVNHIDTSDYYGPHVTNQILRQALHPYPKGLVIVTKLGARRPPDKSWQPAISAQELSAAVEDNLRNLGLDALDIVNYRRMGSGHGPQEGSIAAEVRVLADLRRKGLIRHIGLSNVTAAQVTEAQAITDIVCVQNNYNLVHREDDALIASLAPGHRLRAVLPARRIHADPIVLPVGDCGAAWRYAYAGCACVAPAPLAQHPSHPGHCIPRPSAREFIGRQVDVGGANSGAIGRDRCRGGGAALSGCEWEAASATQLARARCPGRPPVVAAAMSRGELFEAAALLLHVRHRKPQRL